MNHKHLTALTKVQLPIEVKFGQFWAVTSNVRQSYVWYVCA